MLDGKATFELDGEAVDAPPGTFVYVRPESRRKATGDGTVLVVGATPGEGYERGRGRRSRPATSG